MSTLVAIHATSARAAELRRLLNRSPGISIGEEDRQAPDCVIVAHEPPALDALERLSGLGGREGLPEAAVVVVAAMADPRFRRAMLRAGAMDVLVSERLDAEVLSAAIEEAIERFSVVRRSPRRVLEPREAGTPAPAPGTGPELTQRSEVVERLREADERFRALLDSVDDGFCIVDVLFDESGERATDYRFVELNAGFARQTGLDRAAGKRASELVPELDPFWPETYGRVARTGETARFERHEPAMGRTFEVQAMRVGAPERRRVAILFRDVTERRQTEVALRAGEEAARRGEEFALRVINKLFAFVGVLDTGGTLIDANEAPLAAAGIGIGDVRGKKFWDCYWWTFAEEVRQQVRGACERAARGEVVRFDTPVRMAGDTRMIIDFQVAPLYDDAGQVTHLIPSAVEITERKRAEQELRGSEATRRLASEVARVGTFDWNVAENINRWSPELEAVYGLAPGSFEGTYEAWTSRVHPEDLPRAEAATRQALETGALQDEWRVLWPDGSVRWLEVRAHVLKDQEGRPVRVVGVNLDITARREAEEALRRSEARFRRMFETNLLGILFWSIRGGVHDANDEFLRIVGYERADLEAGAIDWVRMTPPEHQAQDERAIEDLRRTGKQAPLEKEYVRKDGSRVWVLVGSALTEGENGVGFVLDISRQKRTEAALRESEHLAREAARRAEAERAILDAILEAAPAGIVLADANGKLLRFNPANEQLWGAAPLSGSIEEYREWKGWWADQSERHGRRLEPHEWAMSRALQGETVRDDVVEIEAFGRPGSRRTMVNSGAPVRDGEGRIIGAVIAQMDISALVDAETARRESEARFRALADNIAQFAWMTDETGSIFWFNRRWFEFTGTTLEEMKGWGWRKVHHPEHVERVVEKFRGHIASGEPWEDTFPLRGRDGRYGWFLSRAVPLRDASGRIVNWFGTNTDVTAQREAEEALLEADRRKDEFIGILAHELRNPLAPVRNAVEILRRTGPAEPRLIRARDIIDRQVTHMARLIDDLLDVSRIARGKLSLRKEPCDLAAIARQTAEDYRPSLEAAGLTLVAPEPDEPVWVEGDPVRLAQMIGNLLHNAGRFTETGGRVEVRTRLDRANRLAVASVTDTGVGIEPELLSRLFDPFSQAQQDLARSKGGLGLGLALTKGLAELHGGGVAVHSEGPDRGSTFTLRIPLSNARYEASSQDRAVAGARQRLRILIVEDNQDAAETLGELLELGGYEVKLAFDGATGVAAARKLQPDVVISDLGLPGELDGYAVARTLRADPAFEGLHLIAVSGYANEEARRRTREAGFDAHLAKPPDIARLERMLEEFSKRRSTPSS